MMMGLPTSGKSTFVNKLRESNSDIPFVICNTDETVKYLYGDNLSVQELEWKWETKRTYILHQYAEQMLRAVANRENVIVDQVNYKKYNRKINLDRFKDKGYLRICIEMCITQYEIDVRMERRRRENQRIVADHIMRQYAHDYCPPSFDEFDIIYKLDQSYRPVV